MRYNMKSALIISFYLGQRRKVAKIYDNDRLICLKKQIEYLEKIDHNLTTVVFSFNLDYNDIDIINEYINKIPKKINNSDVEIVLRKNNGFSYGAWSEFTLKNLEKYDYFIYNEDDYFFIQDNFDDYLINTFNNYENCGYLCSVSREPMGWNNFNKHAGFAPGITSKEKIKIVIDEFEKISKIQGNSYNLGESIQIDFTNCFVKKGLDIYDVRENYRIPFSTTLESEPDIIYFFDYNHKDLLIPLVIEQNNFTYTFADLPEFKKYSN